MSEARPAVEILGPWLLNKGDDLMLRAVTRRLANDYTLAVSSSLGAEELPAWAGLHQVKWRPTLGEIGTTIGAGELRGGLATLRRGAGLMLAPRSLLRSRGFVDGRDLVGLLDCSGFAYGDQWSTRRMATRIAYYDRLKARGVKLVMLPQALGPFETPAVRGPARELLSRFDLIFARDRVSLGHVRSLGIRQQAVDVCPDITHLLVPSAPVDARAWAARVCVVPNARMLDRTSPEVAGRYVAFLARCVERVDQAGLEPWIIVHETNDAELIRQLQQAVAMTLQVYDEDALLTKGVLGACYATLGSRYHSLVSSLSQGTPSIATSWTHKYDAMFEEYGCPECVFSPLDELSAIEHRLDEFLAPARRQALHEQLSRVAAEQKDRVRSMWERVERVLESAGAPVSPRVVAH